MSFWDKFKSWFSKNKKKIIIGGSVVLAIAGATIAYVLLNNKKISFTDWIKTAPDEDLEEAYEKLRLEFCKTGVRTPEMEKINHELGVRGAEEWFKKHPRNTDPSFRWTDANRWEKD